jgi:hypothetical protein
MNSFNRILEFLKLFIHVGVCLLLATLVVWLVADFEAIIYQGTMNLIRGKTLKLALQRQLTIPHVIGR